MSVFLPYLINWLQEYGYPLLWLLVFVAAVGVPLPTSLLLLAAGAFAALGDFQIVLLGIVAISASTCGDNLGFLIGRRWGSRVLNWLEHSGQRLISPRILASARSRFQRGGGWAILLSRFPFSALGGVVNLLAGAELYPYRRFLLFDVSGELLSAGVPLSLGFIFGASWEAVGDILGSFSLLLLGILAAVYLSIRLLLLLRRLHAGQPSRSASAKAPGTGRTPRSAAATGQAATESASSKPSGPLPLG